MRASVVTASAAFATAASVLMAGQASAEPVGRLELSPSTVRAGATVYATTTACGDEMSATGASSADPDGNVMFKLGPAADSPSLQGEFTVPSRTEPGSYDVSIVCEGGQKAYARLTVTRTPHGHVRTGVGGSVTSQVGTGYALAGAALIGGAGLYAWRHRRKPRAQEG
ncbi:LPXTG cell wall anchor domain-containing protein [Streptomyces griseus]|uniref:LPXTG cell wall anchor domain-containing protein n=1 Tax=Streptomyces griseus TaxID=1911 RepID=UPI00368D86E6